ncbi:MAG: hypothetical protein AAFY84_18300 [Pseudomonadota bacterium]
MTLSDFRLRFYKLSKVAFMLACAACARPEYRNNADCEKFSVALMGHTTSLGDIDLKRCNTDSEYYALLRAQFVEEELTEFARRQNKSFEQFNSWADPVVNDDAPKLAAPPHAIFIGSEYEGPFEYQLSGFLGISADTENEWSVIYTTAPDTQRIWSFETDRVPPYLKDSVFDCWWPKSCRGSVSVLVQSQKPYPGFKATIADIDFEPTSLEQARRLLNMNFNFCVRRGGTIRCEQD